jgi:hypothetical protein
MTGASGFGTQWTAFLCSPVKVRQEVFDRRMKWRVRRRVDGSCKPAGPTSLAISSGCREARATRAINETRDQHGCRHPP